METQGVWQERFVFFPQMPVVVEPVEAHLSTDAGLLPVRQLNEALGLTEAIERFEATGQPQRLFTAFWYQAGSWGQARWVVVKAKAHGPGTNRRVVTTNRPGALVLPQAAYDEYAERGESENRNKELK